MESGFWFILNSVTIELTRWNGTIDSFIVVYQIDVRRASVVIRDLPNPVTPYIIRKIIVQ